VKVPYATSGGGGGLSMVIKGVDIRVRGRGYDKEKWVNCVSQSYARWHRGLILCSKGEVAPCLMYGTLINETIISLRPQEFAGDPGVGGTTLAMYGCE